MKNLKMTCFALLGSACLLAAVLVVQLEDKQVLSQANAEMVINSQNMVFLTTRTQPAEEALFVLDNQSKRLLIYKLNLARKRLELAASEDLGKLFK